MEMANVVIGLLESFKPKSCVSTENDFCQTWFDAKKAGLVTVRLKTFSNDCWVKAQSY